MACFLVPAAEAGAAALAAKKAKEKEQNQTEENNESEVNEISLSTKLTWLRNLLLGGAVLLMFEHVWHGEVVPWFPFLTAMADPEDAAEMFHEMATVGVTMAIIVTVVWFGMCLATDSIMKRDTKAEVKA